MGLLFLDIETIGTESPEVIADLAQEISPPANYTKAETITQWEAEKRPDLLAEAVRKTAFDGGLGRVICIGYAFGDDDVRSLYAGTERNILDGIAQVMKNTTVVGHNIGWDLRFLWQRFVVNRIPVPEWLRFAIKAKPWELSDTMLMWNPDRERKTSLDKLCHILGVPTPKSKLDGSKVWGAFKDGRIEEIAEYCCGDVEATRSCYRLMTGYDSAFSERDIEAAEAANRG